MALAGPVGTVPWSRVRTAAANRGGAEVTTKAPIVFDFWACQRPLTRRWGSGQVFDRLVQNFGSVDVAFGKTDGIPDTIRAVDHSNGYEWAHLPFANNEFAFGYWDPPYDHLYKKEGQEIWRTCQRLAILHTHIWPRAWLTGARREGMVAVTMGPMKQIRCLQIFTKAQFSFEGNGLEEWPFQEQNPEAYAILKKGSA